VSGVFVGVEWIRRYNLAKSIARLIPVSAIIALVGCGGGDNSPQLRRTFDFGDDGLGLHVSNEFAAARLSGFSQINDTLYEALIRPENTPVNNSPWYGFKIWSGIPRSIWVRLSYEGGSHRYTPKLSRDFVTWDAIDPGDYRTDSLTGSSLLRLDVNTDTLWVSAEERSTSEQIYSWMNAYASFQDVRPSMIGRSVEGRPIVMLDITSNRESTRFVLLIGRQHPPEFIGSLALLTFLNRIVESDSLARAFRSRYRVLAVPLVNPDGVDAGNWWNNAAGEDLNRDWIRFDQPETSAVRDAFVQAVSTVPDGRVFLALDFHNTRDGVFNSLDASINAFPVGFAELFGKSLDAAVPDYEVREVPSDTDSPDALNWIYRQFGATAIGINFRDEQDRGRLSDMARESATDMMRLLLNVEYP
jgi:cytosolic carboxypeptidase protein 6